MVNLKPNAPNLSTTVTVMVPLLNDREAVGPCLEAILGQRVEGARLLEVIVADGGSSDGSREMVLDYAQRDPRVVLLDNPDRFVPGGLNRAILASKGEVLLRVDSHTVIDPDYVQSALTVLAETEADVVGGAMRPIGTTRFGDAVAWALSSPFGIGGSRFHRPDAEGPVDAVYMGVFPRATFERFGLYHPAFHRNQDDELTYRIREGGGVIWLSPRIRSSYSPRGDLRSVFRQFRGYGRFKPLVLRAHPSGVRLRHLAPALALGGWLLLPGVVRSRVFAVPALAHVGCVALAAASGRAGSFLDRVEALLAMHLGYGLGFVTGLVGLVSAGPLEPPPSGFEAEGVPRVTKQHAAIAPSVER